MVKSYTTRNFLLNRIEDAIISFYIGRTTKKVRRVAKFSHEMNKKSGVLSVLTDDKVSKTHGHDIGESNTTHPTHTTQQKNIIVPTPVSYTNDILNQYVLHVWDAIFITFFNQGISVNVEASNFVLSPVTITYKIALTNIVDYKTVFSKNFADNLIKPGTGVDGVKVSLVKGLVNIVINIPTDFREHIRISELPPGCFGVTDGRDCMTFDLDIGQPGSIHAMVLGMPSVGKTELLKALTYSKMEVHSPDQLKIIVMCTNDKFYCLDGSPYLLCPVPRDDDDLEMVISYTTQLYDHCEKDLGTGLGFKVIVVNDEYEDITDDNEAAYKISERIARRGRNYDFHSFVATQDYHAKLPGAKKFGNKFVGAADSKEAAYQNTKKKGTGVEEQDGYGDFLNLRRGKWELRFKAAYVHEDDWALLEHPPIAEHGNDDFIEFDGFVFDQTEDTEEFNDSGIDFSQSSNKTMPDGDTVFSILALNPSVRVANERYGIKRAAMNANKPIAVRLKELFLKYEIDTDELLSPHIEDIKESLKDESK